MASEPYAPIVPSDSPNRRTRLADSLLDTAPAWVGLLAIVVVIALICCCGGYVLWAWER